MSASLHVGLVINPLAGIGGSLALKGSDGERARELATQLPAGRTPRSIERTLRALKVLEQSSSTVRFTVWAGAMGEDALTGLSFQREVLGGPRQRQTSARDTREAAEQLQAAGVDILLFAGGDGTARDIFDAVGTTVPVLGIPAGVKMHSGVFAVSPEAAGELLRRLAGGGLVGLSAREVRDIDEEAFRHDIVRSRFYGELQVPSEGHFLQQTKVGGKEDIRLAAAEIATWVAESLEQGRTYLIGPGSTTAALMAQLDLSNTLLGVDVVRDGQLLAADADEARLLQLLAEAPGAASIVVTAIGGQGHVFGRGNQQFSPAVIERVGLDNIIVIAAKSKIAALAGRPLLVDTNDPLLDRALCGLHRVITGYDDHILYRIGTC